MNTDTYTTPSPLPCTPSDRPEIRWWLAGGSHTDQTLLESLDEIQSLGFGGIEVLTMAEAAMDRSKYGWDTPAFTQSTRLLLEECTKRGMSFSFTSGPNWQPAVPGISQDSPAAAQELNFNCEFLPQGKTFQGVLTPYDLSQDQNPREPFWPRTQRLLRVVAAQVAHRSDGAAVDLHSPRGAGAFHKPGGTIQTVDLVPGSSVDLTERIHLLDGAAQLTWTPPTDGNYLIFSFWLHGTGQQAAASHTPAFVINHLSPEGFQAQRDYWNRHIFTPEIRRLICENGRVDFFQDSLEIRTSQYSGLFWSERFLEEFQARRGYDLTPLLPTIIQYNVGFVERWLTHEDQLPRFRFVGTDRDTLMRDVFQTQTELYMENYLTPIRRWLNELGIRLRAQTSYGFPTVSFEVSQPISCVDIHETETFEMADEVDYYRLQSGAVHLTRKNIYSAETGATNGGAYYLTPQHYLDKFHRLFAGGINRIIFHGYAAKAGPSGAMHWPGYEALYFDTSDRWGLRHPTGVDLPLITDYLTRTQHLLRQGTPKLDLAILNLSYSCVIMDFWYNAVGDYTGRLQEVFPWNDSGLGAAGYTYEFFAPQYLEDLSIAVQGGQYDAGHTDYQAIIVPQPYLPLTSARSLLKIAQAGVPVLLVGACAEIPAYASESPDQLAQVMAQLRTLANVTSIPNQAAALSALQDMGIRPRIQLLSPAGLMTFLRQDGENRTLFCYNPSAEPVTAPISVQGAWSGTLYNAWSDVSEQIPGTIVDNRTGFSLSLGPGSARVLLLEPAKEYGDLMVNSSQLRPIYPELSPWTLTVEAWEPGGQHTRTEETEYGPREEVYFDTAKRSITLTCQALAPWRDIPQIGETVSGIGTYQATFRLPEDWVPGTPLQVQFRFSCGTISGTVNGSPLPAMDQSCPSAHIGPLVHGGINTISLRVTSTLCNQLIAQGRIRPGTRILKELHTEICDYGLTGISFSTNAP